MPAKKKTEPTVERELSIGDMIRRRRRERGYNQTQAGDILGVNQSTVAKWEVGRDNPGIEKLPIIAEFLGIPFPEVMALYHGGHDPEWATTVSELRERMAQIEEEIKTLRSEMVSDRRGTQRSATPQKSSRPAASRTPGKPSPRR